MKQNMTGMWASWRRRVPVLWAVWPTLVDGLVHGLVFALAIVAVLGPSPLATGTSAASPGLTMPIAAEWSAKLDVPRADFGAVQPSADARQVADWVIATQDNQHAAFVIIDKRAARLYVFDANARLLGDSAVLLGAARGDDTVPGIGQRALADVKPEERTTPAGRFKAERGHNGRGEDVVWIDYDAAVSMHRVLTTNPAEHRLKRLASKAIADKRISYGCVNVPVAFFEKQLSPVFARHPAMVYVLPETKPLAQVFKMAGARLPS